MNFNIKTALLLIILTLPFIGNAQQQFTLRNAIDTALRNNFDIQMSKNFVEIAKLNNTYGVAGGLPNVSAFAGDNGSLSTINTKYNDSTPDYNISNKGENAVNAGVSAGIVLFNGFKITATKERLSRLQNLSEIQLNQQIQNTIADIMITYFDIIRQNNYLKIIQNSLDVSKQKLDIINVKKNVGMSDAVEILQAQTDVNSAEQMLVMQKTVIEQGKSDLLLLINSKKQMEFSVADTIIIDQSLQLDSIINYLNRNPQYLSAEQKILINEQIVKEVSSQRYPSIKLNAGYDLLRANFNKGNMAMNQNYGPTAGINMQIPIFNGNIYKTQKDVAKINVNNSKLEMESLRSSLTTQAIKTYRTYSTTLQQIESQRKNFEMTKQLVDVVMQQFHVSQATILDVRAAQTSFENAAYLLVNLLYSAKVAEIELNQLTYSLGI
jgi:outer membrane protein